MISSLTMGFVGTVGWVCGALLNSLVSGVGLYCLVVTVNFVKEYYREHQEWSEAVAQQDFTEINEVREWRVAGIKNGQTGHHPGLTRGASIFAAYKMSPRYLSATANPAKYKKSTPTSSAFSKRAVRNFNFRPFLWSSISHPVTQSTSTETLDLEQSDDVCPAPRRYDTITLNYQSGAPTLQNICDKRLDTGKHVGYWYDNLQFTIEDERMAAPTISVVEKGSGTDITSPTTSLRKASSNQEQSIPSTRMAGVSSNTSQNDAAFIYQNKMSKVVKEYPFIIPYLQPNVLSKIKIYESGNKEKKEESSKKNSSKKNTSNRKARLRNFNKLRKTPKRSLLKSESCPLPGSPEAKREDKTSQNKIIATTNSQKRKGFYRLLKKQKKPVSNPQEEMNKTKSSPSIKQRHFISYSKSIAIKKFSILDWSLSGSYKRDNRESHDYKQDNRESHDYDSKAKGKRDKIKREESGQPFSQMKHREESKAISGPSDSIVVKKPELTQNRTEVNNNVTKKRLHLPKLKLIKKSVGSKNDKAQNVTNVHSLTGPSTSSCQRTEEEKGMHESSDKERPRVSLNDDETMLSTKKLVEEENGKHDSSDKERPRILFTDDKTRLSTKKLVKQEKEMHEISDKERLHVSLNDDKTMLSTKKLVLLASPYSKKENIDQLSNKIIALSCSPTPTKQIVSMLLNYSMKKVDPLLPKCEPSSSSDKRDKNCKVKSTSSKNKAHLYKCSNSDMSVSKHIRKNEENKESAERVKENIDKSKREEGKLNNAQSFNNTTSDETKDMSKEATFHPKKTKNKDALKNRETVRVDTGQPKLKRKTDDNKRDNTENVENLRSLSNVDSTVPWPKLDETQKQSTSSEISNIYYSLNKDSNDVLSFMGKNEKRTSIKQVQIIRMNQEDMSDDDVTWCNEAPQENSFVNMMSNSDVVKVQTTEEHVSESYYLWSVRDANSTELNTMEGNCDCNAEKSAESRNKTNLTKKNPRSILTTAVQRKGNKGKKVIVPRHKKIPAVKGSNSGQSITAKSNDRVKQMSGLKLKNIECQMNDEAIKPNKITSKIPHEDISSLVKHPTTQSKKCLRKKINRTIGTEKIKPKNKKEKDLPILQANACPHDILPLDELIKVQEKLLKKTGETETEVNEDGPKCDAKVKLDDSFSKKVKDPAHRQQGNEKMPGKKKSKANKKLTELVQQVKTENSDRRDKKKDGHSNSKLDGSVLPVKKITSSSSEKKGREKLKGKHLAPDDRAMVKKSPTPVNDKKLSNVKTSIHSSFLSHSNPKAEARVVKTVKPDIKVEQSQNSTINPICTLTTTSTSTTNINNTQTDSVAVNLGTKSATNFVLRKSALDDVVKQLKSNNQI